MDEGRKIYAIIIAFTAVIIIAMIMISQPGKSNAYTTLYFTNPTEPLVYNAAENTTKIDFTVENHEFKDLNYSYVIVLEYQNQAPVNAAEGKLSIKHNETINISKKLTLQGQGDRIKVSVQLYKEGVNEIYRMIWHELRIRGHL